MAAEVADAVVGREHSVVEQLVEGCQEKLVAVALHRHIDGIDTIGERQVAHGLRLVADGEDGTFASEGGDVACSAARKAVHDDGAQSQDK